MTAHFIPSYRLRDILYAIEARKRKPAPETWWARLAEVLEELLGP